MKKEFTPTVIGKKIKELRTARHMTLEEVGKYLNVGRSNVSKYERGEIAVPYDKIIALSNLFQVSPSYLMGWEEKRVSVFHQSVDLSMLAPIETRKIPLVGKIACGEPILTEEVFSYYVEVGTDIRADFCVKCSGDSMYNARIYDGDVVFIRQQPDVENGEIAAVAIDNAITLKRVYKGPGYIELRAENPKYKPIIVREEDNKDVRIIGKAVAFQADVV